MKKLVSVVAMVAILFVPAVATAQINSNVATVPLQFSISESLSIAVVSGNSFGSFFGFSFNYHRLQFLPY